MKEEPERLFAFDRAVRRPPTITREKTECVGTKAGWLADMTGGGYEIGNKVIWTK